MVEIVVVVVDSAVDCSDGSKSARLRRLLSKCDWVLD